MIEEITSINAKIKGDELTASTARKVKITGKHLREFAKILDQQAADARSKGQIAAYMRLTTAAKNARRARSMTVTLPEGFKLSSEPSARSAS